MVQLLLAIIEAMKLMNEIYIPLWFNYYNLHQQHLKPAYQIYIPLWFNYYLPGDANHNLT